MIFCPESAVLSRKYSHAALCLLNTKSLLSLAIAINDSFVYLLQLTGSAAF
jgi:hypothetical protein